MKTLAICGSMQFYPEMEVLRTQLTQQGFSVYLPEAEENESYYESLPSELKPTQKQKFIDAHLAKIKKSDAILVANHPKRGIDGYVGANTLIEIAFAYALEKPIFMQFPLGEQPCKDELLGMALRSWPAQFESSPAGCAS